MKKLKNFKLFFISHSLFLFTLKEIFFYLQKIMNLNEFLKQQETTGKKPETQDEKILRLLQREEDHFNLHTEWYESLEDSSPSEADQIIQALESFETDFEIWDSTRSQINAVKSLFTVGLLTKKVDMVLRHTFPLIVQIHEELAKQTLTKANRILVDSDNLEAIFTLPNLYTWGRKGKKLGEPKKKQFKKKYNNNYKKYKRY